MSSCLHTDIPIQIYTILYHLYKQICFSTSTLWMHDVPPWTPSPQAPAALVEAPDCSSNKVSSVLSKAQQPKSERSIFLRAGHCWDPYHFKTPPWHVSHPQVLQKAFSRLRHQNAQAVVLLGRWASLGKCHGLSIQPLLVNFFEDFNGQMHVMRCIWNRSVSEIFRSETRQSSFKEDFHMVSCITLNRNIMQRLDVKEQNPCTLLELFSRIVQAIKALQ